MSKITVLKMPSLSPTMKNGNLVNWSKKIGEDVKLGQVIAEIETDKAIMEMESPANGKLLKVIVEEGSNDVAVGTVIGVLGDENTTSEEIESAINSVGGSGDGVVDLNRVGGYKKISREQTSGGESAVPVVNVVPEQPAKAESVKTSERLLITPYAKHLAATRGISDAQLHGIQGTGEKNYIVAKDLDQVNMQNMPSATSAVSASIVQMSSMRKAISKKVCQSKQTVPHFYVSAELDITALEQAKQELFGKYEIKTTINDWFMLAASRALKKAPSLNQVWEVENESLYQNDHVSINCAIDVGNGPLLVLVPDVDKKNLLEIREYMQQLVKDAKDKTIRPAQLETGTFSISNLGMFQVSSFSAIINPPQVAVLAIGSGRDGKCTVTVSCDHRVLDGRDAAIFLQELRKVVETPLLML